MKYLILGQGKSGTTALTYAIAEQVADAKLYFEPNNINKIEFYRHSNLVAKKLLESFNDFEKNTLSFFDKLIFLVRDPRDALVSRVLYTTYSSNFIYDYNKFKKYVDLIKQKETSPHSVHFFEIVNAIKELDNTDILEFVNNLNRKTIEFWKAYNYLFHLKKYESFVQNQNDEISTYLGLTLSSSEIKVPTQRKRVERTKTSGDWKNWFTEGDVKYFYPYLNEFINTFSYSDDWELNVHPVIMNEFASDYVTRVANERKKQDNQKLNKKLQQLSQDNQKLNEQLQQLSQDNQKLIGWIERLDNLIASIVSSNRWKLGNAVYKAYRKITLKAFEPMPQEHRNKIIEELELLKDNRKI